MTHDPHQPNSPTDTSATAAATKSSSGARRRARSLARPAVDLSHLIGSPLIDQGPRPTCVPFALAGTHEAERHAATTGAFQAAIEPVWWHLHTNSLTSPDGVLLTDATASLATTGQCHRDQWPYDDSLGFGTQPPPHTVGSPPWQRARARLFRLAHDGVEERIEELLADGHPIVLVVEITDSFRMPANDGFVEVPDVRTAPGGYHAVIIVGAWTEPHPDRGRVLLIRNSWGVWWGAGGYCLLPVDYLINFAVQAAYLEVIE